MAKKQLTVKINRAFALPPVVPSPPTVNITSSSLGFATTFLATISGSQTYQVSGSNLTGPVVITSPAEFIINTDNSNTQMSPISLPHTGGSVAATTIYVKFSPTNYQTFTSTLANSSAGAITKYVNCNGAGNMESVLVNWWNALTVKPAGQTMIAFQRMMKQITVDNNLIRLDLFHFFGGLKTSQQYLKPIISTSGSDFSPSGTVNYSPIGLGISFSTGYLDLKFKPQINGVAFTTNNGTIGVYTPTNVDGNFSDIGSNDAVNKIQLQILNSGIQLGIVNHPTGASQSNGSSKGFFAAKMDSGIDMRLTKNASTSSNAVAGGATAIAQTLFFGARNNNGVAVENSPRVYECVFVGGDIDILKLYNAVLACAAELGVN